MKSLDSRSYKLSVGLDFKKKIILFALIIIMTFTSTGCWNSRELNSLGIVGIMGLDLDGEKIKITLELIKPSSSKGGNGGSTVSYVQSTGYTVFDAVRNITLKYDRKLFLSHIKMYIFGEEIARSGLIDYLDWFQRDHEPRRAALMLVAKGATAEDVMGVQGGVESAPADYLKKIISLQSANAKVQGVSFLQFLRTYYSSGIESVSGVISKIRKVDIKTKDSKESKFELTAEGSAVFRKGKLIGFLNGDETRGLNFVTNKVKSGLIPFMNPVGKGRTSIEILKSKSDNSVEIEGNTVKIKVSVEMNGMLGEEIGELDLRNPKVITELEELTAREIKEDVKASIEKAKNVYNVDIFGFGNIVHKKYPDKWKVISKEWNELFSKAEVEIKAKVKINRTGLVDIPAKMKEK